MIDSSRPILRKANQGNAGAKEPPLLTALVIGVKSGESIFIGSDVEIQIEFPGLGKAKMRVVAPSDVKILRQTARVKT